MAIAWIANYTSGVGVPSSDYATAIVLDGSGNVYVTGGSYGFGTADDYATVKYNASGDEQWVARYNGPGNSFDIATAIAVDGAGNVYVTGSSVGLVIDYDYATVKYNASGVQQWVARYNGPGNSFDIATAIAVDGSGNVYVTGRSVGSGTDYDYATVKYNASGDEQWVARYNGPGHFDDYATAIAVDGSGNVYVTGYSYGSGTSDDYATVKYNSSGVQRWVARYNGPGNSDDYATAIAVDGSGNVYVTGSSVGLVIDYDYATVKYNASGVQQWVARYNGPGNSFDIATAIAVDGSGNVYVTGGSYGFGTADDYATVKYNASGDEQWVARYNGPGNSFDIATAIAVDGSGNVYVTGGSYGFGTADDYATVKYNASGVQQWVARYNGPGNEWDEAAAIAVDDSGNVYVTGYSYGSGTSYDYATVKYNASGDEQWVARYNGPGNSFDIATAIAVDGSGNVYVTGRSVGSGTDYDYATVKYNASGDEQWVARYNGPGNSWDQATTIAVDGSGNVYVTGRSVGSGTDYDYATVKYNASGIQQWVARYNGPGNSFDIATAIAVDGAGNVYVTGSSVGLVIDYDYATVKYNASGVQQWVARYNGPGNSFDIATAIAVDGSGNVYVTGSSVGLVIDYDYATVKYNSSGVQRWVARYNGPGNSDDYATAIAVDGSGNVYVTGYSYGSGTSDDYATVKYNASGIQQWVARYNGPGNSFDIATAIAVDGAGNVYVTGSSVGLVIDYDYATVKYNASGIQQWVARYNGPGNSFDIATAIAVDGAGNVYVTGSSVGLVIDYDYATVKYNSSGVQRWVARYNGPGNSDDYATAIAVDGSGNVYVTGTATFADGYRYTTIKYRQIPTGYAEEPELPQQFALHQNYPNPFNPTTVIRYQLPVESHVSLKVYDLIGREVATLVNETKGAGYYETTFDASQVGSGVYFYRMQAGPVNGGESFAQVRKFVVMK